MKVIYGLTKQIVDYEFKSIFHAKFYSFVVWYNPMCRFCFDLNVCDCLLLFSVNIVFMVRRT